MPQLFKCPKFEQSTEKGASTTLRDACKKCGRTEAAHQLEAIPPDEIATTWLDMNGHTGKPYYELVRGILTRFVESERS